MIHVLRNGSAPVRARARAVAWVLLPAAFRMTGVGVHGMMHRHDIWNRRSVECAVLCLREESWVQQGQLREGFSWREEARKTSVYLGGF